MVCEVNVMFNVAAALPFPSDKAVRYVRLGDIVEKPGEELATDSKKGHALRQASAILTFLSLE